MHWKWTASITTASKCPRPALIACCVTATISCEVDITLKEPIGPNESNIAANRKKFRGTLEQTESGWQIVWSDAPPVKPGQRVSKKKAPPPLQALGFVLDEVREARLAPVVDFKGRRKPAAANPAQEQPRPENDAQDTE